MFAYTTPHTPYLGPNDNRPTSVPESDYNKGSRDTYVAMVERMDQGVGAILKALRDNGLAENTLMILAVREGDMRFISLDNAGKVQEYLFHLDADPQEQNNLVAAQAGTAARLKRLLREWETRVRPHR